MLAKDILFGMNILTLVGVAKLLATQRSCAE